MGGNAHVKGTHLNPELRKKQDPELRKKQDSELYKKRGTELRKKQGPLSCGRSKALSCASQTRSKALSCRRTQTNQDGRRQLEYSQMQNFSRNARSASPSSEAKALSRPRKLKHLQELPIPSGLAGAPRREQGAPALTPRNARSG